MDAPCIHFEQAHDALGEHRLSRTTSADDEVDLARVESDIDAMQNGLVTKSLVYPADPNHVSSNCVITRLATMTMTTL